MKLLANQPADREIIVLGERDEKLDGQWPGRDGAVSVAGRLAAGLGRSVGWALPPAGAKDLRAWLQANGPDAEALLAALDVQAVEPSAAVQPGRAPVLVRMSDVDPRPLNWLWPNRIPAGRLTLLVGMPGAGKSFLTCDMAARVSTGSRWADGSDCRRGSVILVSAEDDPHDTIRPRLDAAGADVGRIHLLNAVKQTTDDGKQTEWMFTLSDVDMLDSALQRVSDCRLVVVDPIGSFLGGGTDAHRDNEVRAVLAPVAQLAEKHGVAVLVVAHRRKSTASVADDLALGSRAFTGIARSVWHLSCDTNDRERRLLLPGKCNLAPQQCGLSFFIAGEPGSLVWEADPVEMTADDGLRLENAERPGPDPEAATEAVEFLNRALSDGPRPSKDVKEEARVVLATAADRLGAHRQPHLE